ncbi:sigma-70 family RNA polymerase sigma factor [Verminephrobacter eiseniae]|uniref:sigma-70 family RNA polymerase sigma factor n=1 Tax=Verminephrobacter eiseniae TaxID=364317 RepID=UPI00223845DC|nr:sigma-70 family RNA polymerase sigma factor [Verminephrobacter eiseniae]MCW5232333.1 sigma-70 family RNA polymerase sigma factor [Verminephrobacter eiseniae]MCW5296103.1 sigma-70 family RNA polymerase sigma factor [Verminephrobacter eiseniae]MCW8186260.1 sigma-70 family RNA polymerase sigma factor [Verminephrobacter eiseniae]MCW8225644.1 sigma-70 family RNA polymerase sigma factor [Verminephrobacter eiseniae]MCW8235849.1 sigma-70 family RNA polymerase sigma factor [Verminephrobacter eisenia
MSSADTRTVHALYAEHHGWLSTWLRRRLGCAHSAADLAQDTFVRVLLRPQVLPTLREPRAYLTTLAKGVVSEHWRRQALERAYIEALALSPEERLQLLQTLDAIDAMLDGLPHKAREAFVLSQLEGLTYAQIAQRLAISERTVKHHMALGFEHCLALVE